MFQILLTRLFSVATWYYFAFFAISVAMFGLTVGALIVYLFKKHFPDELLSERMALFSLLLGLSIALALMAFLSIPFHPRLSGVGIFSTVLIYLTISIPFVCAGVVVCLCLTRFPGKVGLFYAVDLIGAAIGAFMVVPVLNAMDAPTAIFLSALLSLLGALFFVQSKCSEKLKKLTIIAFLGIFVLLSVNHTYKIFSVEWVKNQYRIPESEAWNTISRIAVYPERWTERPYSWGLSSTFEPKQIIGERMLDMDGVSETVMTRYDGTLASIEHIKYDVTHIAHHMKRDADVFVIGVGGGRDILAARAFNQKRIVGAEINGRILEMVNDKYGDYTGHLDTWPGVYLINDEGRNAITRLDLKFDIIQASCIATWSATSAGAFSLAENSLYTVEGWKIFFDHLKPGGVLSFNRWYSPDFPAQLLRLTSLAAQTLKAEGVKDPTKHIAIVRSELIGNNLQGYSMPSATIMVSKTPFTDEDLSRLDNAVENLKFVYVYNPRGIKNKTFQAVIDNVGDETFYNSMELDLSPPTDDRPFFFHMLKISDLFTGNPLKYKEQSFNLEGIIMLYILLVVSIVLSIIFIFGPLFAMRGDAGLPRKWALIGLLFFAAIGFGYIIIEISQLQRLIIFLGHPIYSITVVLFSMLFASGLGAVFSNVYIKKPRPVHIAVFMVALLAALLFVIYIQPGILTAYVYTGIWTRIAISLMFLFPLGFLMGLPFPVGMELALSRFSEHTPWFWAVNGATGVVSSVMSICISIAWGFTVAMQIGFAFYVLASVFLWVMYASTNKERVS
ncbi:MAG: hypothetical protein KAT46_00605 [Deltaproteobacteria bacterium]|nr:hypothetical protein [Deltaproteobacteria bacterium]